MSIIVTPDENGVAGLAADIYADDIRRNGYVPSHTRVMAMNPEAELAFENLIRAIASQLGARRYELVTLAAARGARSLHCRLAHGAKTLPLIPEQQLVRVATDHHDADLTEAEIAMMDFAEKVSTDASSMTDADSLRLREVGFSDREIVDIALAAAARNYYARAVQALAVDVDVPPTLPAALREALVAGL
ncbi:putative peroxidase-related enzyme [Diaminobutyricimonas aerilata]|uniref:Putative peroxidase-related enzyme n=1 Tax=Diaminobutyricimonas aerilata TaxID=1162967 RepID=A0A2M9CI55_9MICO|nr:carboxymuconolactone decarboxylase [Diaminobutyricimonas aerilata]PJJ71549.1 putative peroxidase-related enzyme [Diaminobutyricimonas aerilata]